MKYDTNEIWSISLMGGKIYYGYKLIVITVFTLLTLACHQENKKQKTPLQATDTLQNSKQRKATSGTRESFPGGDTIQQDCQLVQGQAESLLEEYHQSRTTEARKRQVIVELKKLEQEWKRKECQQVFGYMIPNIPSLTCTGKQIEK